MRKPLLVSRASARRSGRQRARLFVLPLALALLLAVCPTLFAQSSSGPDWSQSRSALGFQGETSGNLLKIQFLRQESITVQGRTVPPAMVLEGYVNLQSAGTSSSGTSFALMFGEFPVRDEEVENFKKALVTAGVDLAALHNHELQEEPRFKFIHVEAFGNAAQLSRGIRAALDSTKATYKDITAENQTIAGVNETKALMPSDAIVQGREGVIDVELDRKENITSCEAVITSSANAGKTATFSGNLNSGLLTACRNGRGRINVQRGAVAFSDITVNWGGGSGDVDADLCLRVNEVNTVIKYLEQNGFKLSAVHNHTLTVRPDLLFVHMSASGNVTNSLKALRTAWDATGGRSSSSGQSESD